MPHTITITIPDDVYQQAEKQAIGMQQTIAQTLSTYLIDTMRQVTPHKDLFSVDVDHEQQFMLGEMAAFTTMHQDLLQHYLGQWVAIHQGQLIDSDWDATALLERRMRDFAGKVVLIEKVEPELSHELYIPSFRLEEIV